MPTTNLSPSPSPTTAYLREQARSAQARLDWSAAADLWKQAQERYPLMPGRTTHGPLALADLANMAEWEAACRAMEDAHLPELPL